MSLFTQAAYASVLHPSAQAFNLQNWNQTARALQPRLTFSGARPALIQIEKKNQAAKAGGGHATYAGQIMVLLLALNGVELVREQARNAKLKGRKLTNAEYSKLAAAAAVRVVDSGDLWFGIAGDVTTTALTQKPRQALKEILKNKVARPLFVNLIHTGIMSLITFVGFQASAQLWREARLLLDPKDYDRSERIWSLGFAALVDLVQADNNSDDARVARQMVTNLAKILFFDDELRANWFYNTWRLSIATGRFVTLVTGIVTAVSVGTAIFPGAGSLLGFIFALGGAVAAASLPASFTEKITIKLKDARIAVSKFDAGRYNSRLKNLVESYSNNSFFWGLQANPKEVSTVLNKLQNLREGITTAYIERIYIANTNVQKFTHELAITTENRRATEYVGVKNLLQTQLTYRHALLGQMLGFYRSQYKLLNRIELTSATPPQMVIQIENEKVELATVYNFLSTFAKALSQSSSFPSSEVVLQNFYLRAFKENGITSLGLQQSVKQP